MKKKSVDKSGIARSMVNEVVTSCLRDEIRLFMSARDSVAMSLVSMIEIGDERLSHHALTSVVEAVVYEAGADPDSFLGLDTLDDALASLDDRFLEVKDILQVLLGNFLSDSMDDIFSVVDACAVEARNLVIDSFDNREDKYIPDSDEQVTGDIN